MFRFLFLAVLAASLMAQTRPNGLYAILNTSKGVITARLYEKDTPVAVATFIKLANRGFYNNIVFHRVVRDEMIQSGATTGGTMGNPTGNRACGFTIPDEFLPGLRFDIAGKLAMANTGEPDSGGCQFFITVNAMPAWTGKYTIFGYVVEGDNVVSAINRAPAHGDKPIEPAKLISVSIQRVGPVPSTKKRR